MLLPRRLRQSRQGELDTYQVSSVTETLNQEVESGDAPDLEGTETSYRFGYLTIVVFGAQRLQIPNPPAH